MSDLRVVRSDLREVDRLQLRECGRCGGVGFSGQVDGCQVLLGTWSVPTGDAEVLGRYGLPVVDVWLSISRSTLFARSWFSGQQPKGWLLVSHRCSRAPFPRAVAA